MKKPISDKAEVLYSALKRGSVSMKEMGWLQGYRTRLSELRKSFPNLFKNPVLVTEKNRHGRAMNYRVHKLNLSKSEVLKIYDKVNA